MGLKICIFVSAMEQKIRDSIIEHQNQLLAEIISGARDTSKILYLRLILKFLNEELIGVRKNTH